MRVHSINPPSAVAMSNSPIASGVAEDNPQGYSTTQTIPAFCYRFDFLTERVQVISSSSMWRMPGPSMATAIDNRATRCRSPGREYLRARMFRSYQASPLRYCRPHAQVPSAHWL